MEISALYARIQETGQHFYQSYEALGRPILDALHVLFQGAFNLLLIVTATVSFIYLVMTLHAILSRKKEAAPDPEKAGGAPMVTVQIPTFNELAAIRCAKACLGFNYPKDRFHILIGDDSDDPSVSKELASFAKRHAQVEVIKRPSNKGFKPGNLNNMLPHSRGDIIVIFDSDFVPGKDFLRRIVQPLEEDAGIAAVQARWTFLNPRQNLIATLGSTIINVFHYIVLPFISRRAQTSFLCGSAEAVRKDVLLKLGGWDSGNLTEDIEYSIRLVNNGYRIRYLSDLTCDSEVPHKPKDLYRQQMRWAYGVIASFKKHFRETARSKQAGIKEKASMIVICTGYFLSVLLMTLILTGTLAILTHPPAPIDWSRLLTETARNILLTSGLILASVVALAKSRSLRSTVPMIASSFSYGLITTLYVNKGIFKAILGRPMQWYMLSKQGNEQYR